MLLSFGGSNISLPKLKTKKSSAKRAVKAPVDDSLLVKARMQQLFSDRKWELITTEEQLIDYLADKKDLGLDTETTGLDAFKDRLVGLSIGTVSDCAYIPVAHKVGPNYAGDLRKAGELINKHNIYGFNAKFDMKVLKHNADIEIQMQWCAFLAARLMNSAEPANDLKSLYVKYVDAFEADYSFRDLFGQPFDCYDSRIVGAYAAVDAMKHIALGKNQELNIGKEERKLLLQLELPLAHDLVDIELTGIELDLEWCEELIATLENDLETTRTEIEAEYPGLNPGSPKQVAEWLFDKLKLNSGAGRGTGEAILKKIDHPLAQKVLEYRKSQKLLSTYARKMPKEAHEGVVHCSFNQYGADTGRFSSSNPNLQNIPRDNRFRKMFKAREGHTLVSCDYSQQEVYILAALAGDETMITAYRNGMDFYAYMASIVFDEEYEDCQKGGKRGELRDQMKSVVLGLNYDMGLRTLANDLKKTVAETKAIYDKFFEQCPRVKDFRQANLAHARKHGYVKTVLGRKRRFKALHMPDFGCDNADVLNVLNSLESDYAIRSLIADAEKEGIAITDRRRQKGYEVRQVVNSVIQGSAADMTKLAMVHAGKDEKLKGLGCKILMQIHDEVVAEFPDETAEEGGKVLAKLMADVGSDLIGINMKCEPALMKVWRTD